jgi:hypothetical protein
MGIDIHGWVEVSHLDPDRRAEEYAWSGIISLSAVIDCCAEVSQLLFGFSKLALTGGPLPYAPIAVNRGIPLNPSSDVQRELKNIQDHERNFGSGEFLGYTYIDAIEIDSIDWRSYGIANLESSDWWLLLRMIRLLRSDHRFTDAGIRIVCWVCW